MKYFRGDNFGLNNTYFSLHKHKDKQVSYIHEDLDGSFKLIESVSSLVGTEYIQQSQHGKHEHINYLNIQNMNRPDTFYEEKK